MNYVVKARIKPGADFEARRHVLKAVTKFVRRKGQVKARVYQLNDGRGVSRNYDLYDGVPYIDGVLTIIGEAQTRNLAEKLFEILAPYAPRTLEHVSIYGRVQ